MGARSQVAPAGGSRRIIPMSTNAISETLDRLSPEERFFAAAYLHHLSEAADEGWRQEIERTQSEMDAGRKFSLDQVRAMHEALNAQGA